jgi:hypothetical protein
VTENNEAMEAIEKLAMIVAELAAKSPNNDFIELRAKEIASSARRSKATALTGRVTKL